MSQALTHIERSPLVHSTVFEDQEHALREITNLLAAKMVQSDLAKAEVDRLYARWSVLKANVVELRRAAGRINCKLADGSRIFDLEIAR